MLPTCQVFAAAMKRLGIRADDTLIVYETADAGIYCALRVAFTLTHFGFPHIHILNSFRQYVADGYPHGSGPFPPPAKPDDADDATALFPFYYRVADPASIISFKELRDLIISSGSGPRYQILDSKTPDCFSGGGSGAAGVVGDRGGGPHTRGASTSPRGSPARRQQEPASPLPRSETRWRGPAWNENALAVLTCNNGRDGGGSVAGASGSAGTE
ncbi:hypothetical protein MY10362_001973 [Beauveria mimosiformis]